MHRPATGKPGQALNSRPARIIGHCNKVSSPKPTHKLPSNNLLNGQALDSRDDNMPFEFVNNAAIDRKARKLIRSHVAKGRNVGKKRQPRRRPPEAAVKCAALYASSASSSMTPSVEDVQIAPVKKDIYSVIDRQIGDGWSILSFPTEVAPGSKAVVQRGMAMQRFSLLMDGCLMLTATSLYVSQRTSRAAWTA